MNNNAPLVVEDPLSKLNITQNVPEKILKKFIISCVKGAVFIEMSARSGKIVGLVKEITNGDPEKANGSWKFAFF